MSKTSSALTRVVLPALALGLLAAGRSWLRQSRRMSLAGAHVVITGGSRGLGLLLARELALEGCELSLLARSEDELIHAQADLETDYRARRVNTYVCDITDPEQVSQTLARVRAEGGPVDVLINNAGQISAGPYNVMTRDDYEQSLKVHFWGAYHTSMALIPHMVARGQGRIVNIASIGGKVAVPHLLPYSVGKFAMVGFSEGLRSELMSKGVLVTTVCPGLMRTGSQDQVIVKGTHDPEFAIFKTLSALPIVSMAGAQAARQIIEAMRYGEAELILTGPARLLVAAKGIAPGLVAESLALAAMALPEAGPGGTEARRGADISSRTLPILEARLEEAARDSQQPIPEGGATRQ